MKERDLEGEVNYKKAIENPDVNSIIIYHLGISKRYLEDMPMKSTVCPSEITYINPFNDSLFFGAKMKSGKEERYCKYCDGEDIEEDYTEESYS